jgi:citrate lyase gamma subunit
MTTRDTIDRRTLLRAGSAWAVASLFGCKGAETAAPPPATYTSLRPAKSRVVLVRRRDVLRDDGALDGGVLRAMLNEAVASAVEAPSSSAAWRHLLAPSDVVGIKSNVWQSLPTPAALEDAIRAEVVAAGVSAGNVAVNDRGVRQDPVFARATALINTRPMRTHAWSGLGTCLKNYIMFVPRPPDYHDDACASLGAIWRQPGIEGKTRLNVLVMLTPQFHGLGPHSFSPQFTWRYGGLVVGTDVVAVDAVGARIIQAKRRAYFGDDRPISPPPHHIQFADTRYALGNSTQANIDLVRLGEGKDSLI